MNLDIVSSLISIGALTTVMGLWMISASYLPSELNSRQLRIWGLSCLIFGISFALFATRESTPVFWSLVVGNLLYALGFVGFGLAIARLLNRRFPFLIVLTSVFLCTLP